jgi:hypothetical protein
MKPVVIGMVLTLALLAACGPAPRPQPTPDILATSQALSATMVAGTLTAQPTATLPPTDTPTLLARSTKTPAATKTLRPRPTKTTYVPFTGCFTPTGVTNFSAPFKIENMTPNRISVFINGVTRTGEHPVNCSYNLKAHSVVIFTIWWGDYTYLVQITGRTTYQGSFWVNDTDKATMRVTKKGIQIGPFP